MNWPEVPIGSIATAVERPEIPIPGLTYRQIGVKLWGEGAYERASIDGGTTRYPRLFRCDAFDLIVNKIWARNGSVAIVPSELAGCYASSEFPTFALRRTLIEPGWIHWLSKTPGFWQRCDEKSRGTSGKNRIRPERFLEVTIPLPPLPVQRRIVTRLDTVASKLSQIDSIRQAGHREAERFLVTLHSKLSSARVSKLAEFLELEEHTESVRLGREYPQMGLKSFGGGLFAKPPVAAEDTSYKAFNRLYSGALVLSQVKGWEGAIAVCPPEVAGFFVSPEYRTFRCIPGQAVPEYLATIVVLPWFWERLQEATRGVGARRERTRPEAFLKLAVPMPTAAQQEAALPILRRLVDVSRARTAIEPLLDALRTSSLNAGIKAVPAPVE